MIVCIAEKPSVARDIAEVLGAHTRKEGYIEGNGYQVTWTFGHLCTLKEPHEYTPNWKSWNLGSLPMIPPRFGIKLIENPTYEKQFHIIEGLMQNADEIINCGDAGQEGELIQRWVMQKAGARCPVKRLWISSLTEEAIREGFAKLKDQTDFQSLYEAGLSRAMGDWLLGMNATRLYTIKYGQNKQVLSIGRVQTPTLALIVNRQLEIANFEPKQYWELKTNYRDTTFSALIRKSDEEIAAEEEKNGGKKKIDNPGIDPIANREEGEALVERIKDLPFVDIILVPVGGGGLATGVSTLAKMLNPNIKVIGVEPAGAACLKASLANDKVTTLPKVDTIADGTAVKTPGTKIFPYLKENLDDIITVEDSELIVAFLDMLENHKMLVENSGLLTVAALKHLEPKGQKVVSILSGGNMDVITFSSVVQHGLIARSRIFTVSVLLPDKPGELQRVAGVIAGENGNIIKLEHNQFVTINRNSAVELVITIEAFGPEHKEQILRVLSEQGYRPIEKKPKAIF